jgi:hypothetical protein
VFFGGIFFIIFLPLFAFRSLPQPSAAFIGTAPEKGVWRGFWEQAPGWRSEIDGT